MATVSVRQESLYRTVWRWHFYAGLFCVPFILWLSVTGGIYLFKPQIQALIDRPYNGLSYNGPLAPPSAQAKAAVDAVPGSVLHRFVLSERNTDATQIVVGVGRDETRVYLNPQTLKVLRTVGEEDQFLSQIFRLHGELMAGHWGSALVELAASWTIIMILTGLFLWWPREGAGLAGTVYPRLRRGKRVFWRDLHAVTGIWVSFFALFLILSGLPWADNWGNYLKTVRSITVPAVAEQDWSAGSAADARTTAKLDARARTMMGEHSEHGGMTMHHMAASLDALDVLVPHARALHLAGPVEISPPTAMEGIWAVKSNAANRPLRTNVEMDGRTGTIFSREDFAQRQFIDRLVGYGVALHEGAFFGLANQLASLVTIVGLILLTLSSVIIWWRRRPKAILGAPQPQGSIQHSWLLVGLAVGLGFLVPLYGISLAVVLIAERLLLRRWLQAVRYLSLQTG